ncbi:MAG: GNAT family N-acetyltransferase [Minisyncoccales bacterium]
MKKIKKFGNLSLKIQNLSKEDIEEAELFQKFLNNLIEEDLQIRINETKTLKEEKDWIKKEVKKIKERKKVQLVVKDVEEEVIIAMTEIKLLKGKKNHVGEFGISVVREYRNRGIGSFLTGKIVELAKKELKLKTIKLSVYKTNKPAIHVYKKAGFKKVAEVPNQFYWKDKYINEVIMLKTLED